jgi:hypothetical protein
MPIYWTPFTSAVVPGLAGGICVISWHGREREYDDHPLRRSVVGDRQGANMSNQALYSLGLSDVGVRLPARRYMLACHDEYASCDLTGLGSPA